jgi:hypothetical protein
MTQSGKRIEGKPVKVEPAAHDLGDDPLVFLDDVFDGEVHLLQGRVGVDVAHHLLHHR